jgi:thioredoxin 1
MADERKPLNLNKDSFDSEVLESSLPVLVDFWADWCAPCRRVSPVVERLAGAYAGRLDVAKLNVDDEPELARRYDIRSIPALLVFRDGEVVDRFVGAASFEELEKLVEPSIETN